MKITVITVCFNSAAYIADALRSVDAQTWPDVEHLIIDGGSSDNTLDIVAEHPRPWRLVTSEPDRGIYDAMNKGIRLATGEVVGLINSDDFYESPEVLAKVAAVFADPSIDACYGDLCYVRRDDTTKIVRYWRSSPFEPGLFGRGWAPPHPTLFVRRSVFSRHGVFDLAYPIAADMELMARFFEVHGVRSRYLPEVLVHMRMGGASNRSLRSIIQQNREILRALRTHELSRSAVGFVFAKLLSRSRQLLSRPG
jgi:glycosyltransferase involved in cell wall biosynthesis